MPKLTNISFLGNVNSVINTVPRPMAAEVVQVPARTMKSLRKSWRLISRRKGRFNLVSTNFWHCPETRKRTKVNVTVPLPKERFPHLDIPRNSIVEDLHQIAENPGTATMNVEDAVPVGLIGRHPETMSGDEDIRHLTPLLRIVTTKNWLIINLLQSSFNKEIKR